jgi:hypothetical protein
VIYLGLIDKHVKKIIEMATAISGNNIFNIYQIKGALPEKLGVDDKGNTTLNPFTQADMFVVFGIEEGDNGGESVIINDEQGAPENKIAITTRFNIKVLFNGEESDFYALKFKARLWSRSVQAYLENNNISLLTQNPSITFETEEVAGEFWDKRGIQFVIVIELHFDDDVSEEFEVIGDIQTHK